MYKAKSQTSVNLKGDNTMKELQKQIEKTKKGSLEYCIGQMLLSRCEGDTAAAEIVEKDLATKGMELTACAKKLFDYARAHKQDEEAEKIIFEFYGIGQKEPAPQEPEKPVAPEAVQADRLMFSLEDLL